MGRVKEQMMWRSEHATDWEEDLPTWYQYHERELDQMTSEVIVWRCNQMVEAIHQLTLECSTDLIGHEEVIETMGKYEDENLMEDEDPVWVDALEFWIVEPWFGDELKERGEIVNTDFLGFVVWGRQTSGQAISMDYVVQDILKDIVERRKANG
jgi:hypothetical protein